VSIAGDGRRVRQSRSEDGLLLHQAKHAHGCASFRRRYKLEDHDPPTDVPSTGAQERHPTAETARRKLACVAASGKYIEIGASSSSRDCVVFLFVLEIQ
jgi:hypothetical protein